MRLKNTVNMVKQVNFLISRISIFTNWSENRFKVYNYLLNNYLVKN